MMLPRQPNREGLRLLAREGASTQITPADSRFERITRLAARLLAVSSAVVTLSDNAFDARGVVVEDALLDRRLVANALVETDRGFRFYASEPVRCGGRCVGALWVFDTEPRPFPASDVQVLRDLAALVEAELERGELERRASIDHLTHVWNRSAIFDLLADEVARASRNRALTVAMIDVDNFKRVNDTYGHAAGDSVLAEIATRLRGSVRECDCLGRYGGEEFVALLGDCAPEHALKSVTRILRGVSSKPIVVAQGAIAVTISIGFASYGAPHRDPQKLLAAADAALYRAKADGKNRAAAASKSVLVA